MDLNGSSDNLQRYLELFCSPDSKLWRIHDYKQRKEEALKQAGFSKDELYEAILNDRNPDVINAEVQYAFDNNGADMAVYVALLKNFWQNLNRLATPVDDDMSEDKELKCFQLKRDLRKDIQEAGTQLKNLELVLFKDKEGRRKVISKVKETISAESMAQSNSVR
jgi:hypothetical protein